jgi:hypothetical protein
MQFAGSILLFVSHTGAESFSLVAQLHPPVENPTNTTS